MSEIIERVALAISGSDDPVNILAIHRSQARAAIEAMRNPTNEMLGGKFGVEPRRLFTEMLDAALQ